MKIEYGKKFILTRTFKNRWSTLRLSINYAKQKPNNDVKKKEKMEGQGKRKIVKGKGREDMVICGI